MASEQRFEGQGPAQACPTHNIHAAAFVGPFFDASWQCSVQDTYKWSENNRGTWVIRSEAEPDHGGGQVGAASVQDDNDIGLCEARAFAKMCPKTGRNVTIKQVRVLEQVEGEGDT